MVFESRRRAMTALVVAAACWGLDTTLSAYALDELKPATLLLAETVVGASAVWLYLIIFGKIRRPASVRPYLLLGLIEPGVSYLFVDLGLRRTSAISGGI